MRTNTTANLEILADEFTEPALAVYWNVGRTTRTEGRRGFYPTRFLHQVRNDGAVAAVKSFLRDASPNAGLERLAQLDKLELSIESLVLREPWSRLFTQRELSNAQKRLDWFQGSNSFDDLTHSLSGATTPEQLREVVIAELQRLPVDQWQRAWALASEQLDRIACEKRV